MSTLVSGVRSTINASLDQFIMHDLVASNSIFGCYLNKNGSHYIFYSQMSYQS